MHSEFGLRLKSLSPVPANCGLTLRLLSVGLVLGHVPVPGSR